MSAESFVTLLLTFAVFGFAFVAVCSLLAGVWWLIDKWPTIEQELWGSNEAENLEVSCRCASEYCGEECLDEEESAEEHDCAGISCPKQRKCPCKVVGLSAISAVLLGLAVYAFASGKYCPISKKLRKRF